MQVLRMLAVTEHELAAVLTTAPATASAIRGASVHAVAEGFGLPVLPATLVKDPAFAKDVARRHVDLILNIHSLYVMHEAVAASARIGAFNLHPGPLPAYAGLNSPSWAILHGETQHGVTLHWMDASIDTGPIAYQTMFGISGDDTALSVARRCVREGLPLVETLLDDAGTDRATIPRREQDLSRRSYFGREVPHDGVAQWTWPAQRVVDFVRACDYYPLPSPWGYPTAYVGDREITLARARTTGRPSTEPPGTMTVDDDQVAVACADEWIELTHAWHEGRRVPAGHAVRGIARRRHPSPRRHPVQPHACRGDDE